MIVTDITPVGSKGSMLIVSFEGQYDDFVLNEELAVLGVSSYRVVDVFDGMVRVINTAVEADDLILFA